MTKDQLDSYNKIQAKITLANENLNRATDQFTNAGLANADEERMREVNGLYMAAVREHIAIVNEMAKALNVAGINV